MLKLGLLKSTEHLFAYTALYFYTPHILYAQLHVLISILMHFIQLFSRVSDHPENPSSLREPISIRAEMNGKRKNGPQCGPFLRACYRITSCRLWQLLSVLPR